MFRKSGCLIIVLDVSKTGYSFVSSNSLGVAYH